MTDSASQQTARVVPPCRILVVDDDPVVHACLARTLGRQGHAVVGELGAAAALRRLATEPVDLIIVDFVMPQVDGLGFLAQLPQRALATPVILMTGYATVDVALQAMRLGAIDYLPKPFTRRELIASVNRALRRPHRWERSQRLSTWAELAALDTPWLHRLAPGRRVRLRAHSWVGCRRDDAVHIGIDPCFLRGVGRVLSVSAPRVGEVIEQGRVGLRLLNTVREEHAVLMPLSGQVVAVNDVLSTPGKLTPDCWVLQLSPSMMSAELPRLAAQPCCSD